MIRIFALFQTVSRGHARGLLLPVSLMAYFLLACMAAAALRIEGREGMRQGAALILDAGAAILFVCAAVMPLASLPFRRRTRSPGSLGDREIHGAVLAAHGLVLLGVASALAVASVFVLGLRFGLDAIAGGDLPLRELVATAPGEGVRLRAGPHGVEVPLPAGAGRNLHMEMRPKVALLEGAPAAGAFGAKGAVALLAADGTRLLEMPFDAQRGGTVRLSLSPGEAGLPPLDAPAAAGGPPVRVVVRLLDSGKELRFDPGTISVTGEGRMILPTLILGFHLAALRAFLLCTLLHGFAGFTRFPVALMAAATAMLAAAATGVLGRHLPDAGEWLSAGFALKPAAVVAALGIATGAAALAVAATAVHHRIQEHPR